MLGTIVKKSFPTIITSTARIPRTQLHRSIYKGITKEQCMPLSPETVSFENVHSHLPRSAMPLKEERDEITFSLPSAIISNETCF